MARLSMSCTGPPATKPGALPPPRIMRRHERMTVDTEFLFSVFLLQKCRTTALTALVSGERRATLSRRRMVINNLFSGPLWPSFVGKNFDTRQGACWGQLRDEAVTLLPTCQQQALAPSTFLISIVISLSPMAPAASQDPSSKANLARTADSHRHTCHRRHTKKEVKVLRASLGGQTLPAP